MRPDGALQGTRMRGLALVAALLCRAAAAPALTVRPRLGSNGVPAGQVKWRFFPLHVISGQVKVSCGSGSVVEWFVKVGDYVKEGDPICETCPDDGASITCTAPASGQVVAEQPLGPDDDIRSKVPDGVVAVLQPSGGRPAAEGSLRGLLPGHVCHPVKCDAGVSFGQFLVSKGDTVQRGEVVALALTAEGTMDHCRAPVDGRLAFLAQHIQRGQAMDTLDPPQTVGCVVGNGKLTAKAEQHTGGGHHRTCVGHNAAGAPNAHASVAAREGSGKPKAVPGSDGAAADGDGGEAHPTAGGIAASPRNTTRAALNTTAATAAGAHGAGGKELPAWLRRRLPQADHDRRKAGGGKRVVQEGAEQSGAEQSGAPALLVQPAVAALIWASVGLVLLGALGLGAFMLYGKSQTRSLYMLMQDTREEPTKGLRVDFRDGNGSEKSFSFESQPLGIVFSKQQPVRVERFEFNSYAKDRGVQLGWTLARIGQQEITAKHSLPDVDRTLHSHVKTLAFWPLRVDFDTGNGAIKAFFFVKQPLGIEITRHAPFRIALFKPDSYAKRCGVEVGWIIVRVGDAVINQRTGYSALNAYFESGLGHLPQEPKGLRMDFSDPSTGKDRIFYFQRRPLGLALTKYKPVRVQGFDFNSYAKERGVQIGWTITKVGDQVVGSGLSPDQVDTRILENSATLAVWPLRVDFDTGKGVRTFYFERQPLGMELLNRLPIRVDTLRPDSYARTCGVQMGWAITRVGDHEVTRETKFEQVIECLVEGVCELPLVDAQQPAGHEAGAQRGSWSRIC